jgi:glycine betaine catabolism B
MPWRTGKVTQLKDETAFTRRFWIEVPELEAFNFIPGQFVTLDLPIHEKANKRWRSYSIASWPDQTNVFELIIVRLQDGAGTSYLFDEVQVGTELTFRGAQGVFILPSTLDQDLYLICTGTGVAPFRSMLHHILHSKLTHQKIYLLFGTRTRADLLYYEEFIQLEKDLEDFHYLPVLSRENWDGNTGYVHEVYEKLLRTSLEQSEQASIMLCGWKNMIDEAKQKLLSIGIEKKNIHLELYG